VTLQQALDLNREAGNRVMHAYILGELAAAQRLTGDGPGSIRQAFRERRDMPPRRAMNPTGESWA
jgi:hypothetical protein